MKKISRFAAFAALIYIVPALAQAQTTLANPLTFQNISSFVAGALQVLVEISLPVIGFFIVLTGYKFVAAQGNEAKLSEAKRSFMYVIIGAGLVLGAWVLATLIGSTVSQLVSI